MNRDLSILIIDNNLTNIHQNVASYQLIVKNINNGIFNIDACTLFVFGNQFALVYKIYWKVNMLYIYLKTIKD